MKLSQKESGAYFTPDRVVKTLLHWAIRSPSDRMIDPACGDGRFIAGHRNSVGIEQDSRSASAAMARAPWALVHEGEFFLWASSTSEQFDCAVGNPPFIRYQTFNGDVRDRALSLCRSLGSNFSGLTSSWAPFLVATASRLKPGGRMAFVVPAEIGHAPYAAPLLEYLVENFAKVHIVAVRSKLFPELSEDCWLLYTDEFGGKTSEILFTASDEFRASHSPAPPSAGTRVSIKEWRDIWKRRLRPFLLPSSIRDVYREVARHRKAHRLGEIADIGIGYVSGANDFFHLRPSTVERLEIPTALLRPTVRNGRALPPRQLTNETIESWHKADEPMLLLNISREHSAKLPIAVRRYLDSDAGMEARKAYKCRTRDPWYAVPDVQTPDFFLSYMSGVSASFVRNAARATCTNSVHSVRVNDYAAIVRTVRLWSTDFLALSREVEGHPLGGGMLKLEPREAAQILVPPSELLSQVSTPSIAEAVATMRRWRHYATK